MWRLATRLFLVCSTCCAVGLMVSSGVAFGEAAPSGAGGGGSSLEGSLVTPGSPAENEQLHAQEEAKLANPDAVAQREASRTKFEGQDSEHAVDTDGEAFSSLIDESMGGPPKLPVGESIVGYPADNAAQVDLPEGKHGVIESTGPIAVQTGPGQRAPIDLSLSEAGGAFAPKTPLVGVEIPKRLGAGVSLGDTGVSLTPVDEHGVPLGGSEGALEGASVLYANTQTDTDTVVKPVTAGFEVDAVLRSVESPGTLYFRVGMPAGAQLVREGSGSVKVLDGGETLARVPSPVAQDAEGAPVGVATSVSGDVLALSVNDGSGEHAWPIVVDPEVEDSSFASHAEWHFEHNGSAFSAPYQPEKENWTETISGSHSGSEWGGLFYTTKGESRIVEARVNGHWTDTGSHIQNYLELVTSGGVKKSEPLPASDEGGGSISGENSPANNNNTAGYFQESTGSGEGTGGSNTLTKATATISQENGPTLSFNTNSEKLSDGQPNVLYEKKQSWLGSNSGAFELDAKDPGVGINIFEVYSNPGEWADYKEYEDTEYCHGIQCPEKVEQGYTYNFNSHRLPDGEDNLTALTEDGVKLYAHIEAQKIKVDGTPPYNLALTGLPSSGVINEGQFHLTAKATDGKAPTPSSGVKEIYVGLDGYRLPGKGGACTPGPCTASGEWTFSGESVGVGKHTLELVAVDNADNYEVKKYPITVHHTGVLSVGPGSVDPSTGAFHLSASDVSLSGGRGSLGFSRSYDSRQLTAGEQGPLGPQWSSSISGSQKIEQEPSGGNVVLVNAGGGRTMFESNGKGGFVAPKGDENLVLEAEKEGENIKAYLLKNPAAGTTVKYVQPGGTGPWVIASSEGALSKTSSEKETVEWERVENVTRPKLALAPTPAGVKCLSTVKEAKELADGCRALSFTYATETTAAGEAPSQWKAYKGRLMQVSFTAENPSTKAMETKPVAEYAYDAKGRLRAEWDPRLASPLKTTYGYDSEGHVVAVDPAGQEPWLLHYGTTASDPGVGRLLSSIRPPAGTSTQVKEQDEESAPANTGSPTLSSTSPVIGTTVSVSSNGTWSNGPLTYSDSWEDCYTYESKETCTAIPGAVNSSYTPQERDAGYTLKAQVTAVNVDGAAVATTFASKALAGVVPAYHAQFGKAGEAEAQFKAPSGTAIDAGGDVWVADSANSRVQELSASGTFIKAIGWGVSNGKAEFETCTSTCKAGIAGSGAGQFSSPAGIAINQSSGNVYVLDKGNNRVEEFNSEGKYVGAFGKYGKEPGQLNAPNGIVIVPAGTITSSATGEVWVGDTGNNRVDEFAETSEKTEEYIGSFGAEGSGNGQFKGPDGIAFSGEDAYVVDSSNDRVQEFSLSGQYVAKFGAKGAGNGQFETPYGIATEPVSGDLYVADTANNRVEEFNPAGTFVVAVGKKGEGSDEYSSPESITGNPAGDLYVADTGNNRVQELEPKYSTNDPLPEPPALGASAVTTIDYNVPVSGTGAPHEMTKAELEKWGQIDEPTEATAVFPPDEPMGWPAKDYKRATISYYDEFGRKVNVAAPSSGIATSEYNEDNEVIRSLSADNRAAALKESESRKVSELLDTKSQYNSAGTELESTRGPQHSIKLAGGAEKQARNRVRYHYDQGAPEGETYNLVTSTTDAAEYEGQETEVRTTSTSYSGQNGLGWKLRKPTSVTTEPTNGLKDTFDFAFGAEGEVGDRLHEPGGVAIAPNGNVWVADTEDRRVEEFTSAGGYVVQFGGFEALAIAVAPDGDVYVAGEKVVKVIKENGEAVGEITKGEHRLSNVGGVAVSPSGNVYVTTKGVVEEEEDKHKWTIMEFNSKNEYVRGFASEMYAGEHCNHYLKAPHGISVAPDGNVMVTDPSENCVAVFSPEGEYKTRLYEEVSFNKPEGVAGASNGIIYVADTGNNRIEEFTEKERRPIGEFGTEGTGNGQFRQPTGIAVAPSGDLYVADTTNNRIERWGGTSSGLNLIHTTIYDPNTGNAIETRSPGAGPVKEGPPVYTFKTAFGAEGEVGDRLHEPGGVTIAPNGNVWVADTEDRRVEEFTSAGGYVAQFGGFEALAIAVAPDGDVYVAGERAVKVIKENGEVVGELTKGEHRLSDIGGVAVSPSGNVYVTTKGEVEEEDKHRWTVMEFNSKNEYIRGFAPELSSGEHCNHVLKAPHGISVAPDGNVMVTDPSENCVAVFSSEGEYKTRLYEEVSFNKPEGVAGASNGIIYVADTGNNRIEEFTEKERRPIGEFGTEGTGNGQLKQPMGIAATPSGDLWHGAVYVADTGNNRIQKWETPTGETAHASQTIYYSTETNATYPQCGGHPEWANLPCQSQLAAQPGTSGLPELPVTVTTYNVWDEPETATEKFGSTTRTKSLTYETAGRLLTTEEKSSIDTPISKVTDEYSPQTGVMAKQSTTVGEATKSIKSVYNTLGQLTEYTDADGNTTQYVYSGPVNDGQVEEVKYGGNKGSQMYAYDPTTKALTKLLDVGPEGSKGAGTFTAGYDVEGKMTSETYPNGMTAKYAFNPASETTGIEYEKTAHCAGTCPEVWFKEAVVPSIHGEALVRTSTLAKEEYTYDNAGRLTQVNETPAGKGCKTRIYAYNEDSDRTSETTRESATETCATAGGTEEKHKYDEADRLDDTGVGYETFGNQTKIPAADAGQHEIAASFYVDNQIAVQKQNSETTSYSYDPAGRTEKTVSEGTTQASVINHYAGPGEAISWACEEAVKECEEGKGTKWTRNIPGIDGSLAATQHDGEAAVLQLHDLEGDIVATAGAGETETKPLTTYNPTEFGVQVNGTPPTKFSWLGAGGVSTEASSGAANPGGASYVPQLGAPLQTQPVAAPGAFANGASGYGLVLATYTVGGLLKNQALEEEASRQAAAKREAEEKANMEACPATECHVDGPGEGNFEAGEGGAEEPEGFEDDPKFKAEFCAGTSTVNWDPQDPAILLFVTVFHCTQRVYVRAWNFAGPEETNKFERTNGKPISNGLFQGEINLLLDTPFPLDLGICIETRRGRPGSGWGPLQCFPFELPPGFTGP